MYEYFFFLVYCLICFHSEHLRKGFSSFLVSSLDLKNGFRG